MCVRGLHTAGTDTDYQCRTQNGRTDGSKRLARFTVVALPWEGVCVWGGGGVGGGKEEEGGACRVGWR